MAIGVPYEVFWHLIPNELRSFYKAYRYKQKIEDEKMWYMGQYVMSALDSTVCNNSLWKGKNGKPSKYIEKPILSQDIENTNKSNLPDKEKQKKVENLFMQLEIMGANYNLKNKDSSVS